VSGSARHQASYPEESIMFAQYSCLSPKRRQLCSRENASRVASRLFDQRPGRVTVVKTGNPLQPFRVCSTPALGDRVELEMVS
jgi:hypothetical protein